MATTITTRSMGESAPPMTPPSSHLFLSSTPAIPNKHLTFSEVGPGPEQSLPSPPTTPQSSGEPEGPYLLHPPHKYQKAQAEPAVYALTASELSRALEEEATKPLADPQHVFPWLHGLSSKNQMQLAFFRTLSKSPLPGPPRRLRGVTIVKTGGNLACSRLQGAISPDELLLPKKARDNSEAASGDYDPCFLEPEPAPGFGVRNFKIQCCKLAMCSDIVIYGDDNTPRAEVMHLATLIAEARKLWDNDSEQRAPDEAQFNTFVLTESFETVEREYPDLVACSAHGDPAAEAIDFVHQEKKEMAEMTKVSEIARNVFLGPVPQMTGRLEAGSDDDHHFEIWIETSDYARVPEMETLEQIEGFLERNETTGRAVAPVEFPSSGSFGGRGTMGDDTDAVVMMCEWIDKIANGDRIPDDCDKMAIDGKSDEAPMKRLRGRKVLIYCSDGYTESSLLALAYTMYAECIPAAEAFVRLHRDKKRNFFAYSTDKLFLECAERQILWRSPRLTDKTALPVRSPSWMQRFDGSLPSRILPYMYLGNLTHATNPGVLGRLGITHVLSVGEPIDWHQDPSALGVDCADWPEKNFLYIDKVQDNGVDPLTKEFERCLEFIGKAKAAGGAVLVHCHRGVSRSATICIAEVMKGMSMSFPHAYCFVRARRLNVIIQPHLLFAYELLKYEELLCQQRGVPLRRKCEWATIAREIAILNQPYCKQ